MYPEIDRFPSFSLHEYSSEAGKVSLLGRNLWNERKSSIVVIDGIIVGEDYETGETYEDEFGYCRNRPIAIYAVGAAVMIIPTESI